MTQIYFLNSDIAKEIINWQFNYGSLISKSQLIKELCQKVAFSIPDPNERENLYRVLISWLENDSFQSLLQFSIRSSRNIKMSEARNSLSQISNSESFVCKEPIITVLTKFSALLHKKFQSWKSKFSLRVDQLILTDAYLRKLSIHDFSLILFTRNEFGFSLKAFDHLLSIQEDVKNLNQPRNKNLSKEVSAETLSAFRKFALGNFETALKAFLLILERNRDIDIATLGIILSLVNKNDFEQAHEFFQEKSAYLSPWHRHIMTDLFLSKEINSNRDKFIIDFLRIIENHFDYSSCTTEHHLISTQEKIKEESEIFQLLLHTETNLDNLASKYIDDPPLEGSRFELGLVEIETIAKIKNDYSNILDYLIKNNLVTLKKIVINNLACIEIFQNQFAFAIDLIEKNFPNYLESSYLRINMALCKLAIGQLSDTIDLLNVEPFENQYKPRTLRLKAEAFYLSCCFDDSKALWQECLNAETNEKWKLRIYARLLEIFRLEENSNLAQKCVDILATQYVNEAESLFALSFELWHLEKYEQAIETLLKSKALSSQNLSQWISWELSYFYLSNSKILSSTDELLSISNENKYSPQYQEYLITLYKSGLKQAAYEKSLELRLKVGLIPEIAEIEADYLINIGESQQALDLLNRIDLIRPLRLKNRISRLYLYIEQEKVLEAENELQALSQLTLPDFYQLELQNLSRQIEAQISQK